MDNESTKNLVWKGYYRVKSLEKNMIGKTWVMYKNKNITMKPRDNLSTSYQMYTPTAV